MSVCINQRFTILLYDPQKEWRVPFEMQQQTSGSDSNNNKICTLCERKTTTISISYLIKHVNYMRYKKPFYKVVQNEFHATCKVLSHSFCFLARSSKFHWKTKLYDSNLFICLFFFPWYAYTPEHIDNEWLTTAAVATATVTTVVVVFGGGCFTNNWRTHKKIQPNAYQSNVYSLIQVKSQFS